MDNLLFCMIAWISAITGFTMLSATRALVMPQVCDWIDDVLFHQVKVMQITTTTSAQVLIDHYAHFIDGVYYAYIVTYLSVSSFSSFILGSGSASGSSSWGGLATTTCWFSTGECVELSLLKHISVQLLLRLEQLALLSSLSLSSVQDLFGLPT